MKVLVTGASGFIGSHVCDNLRDRGIEPIRFDRRAPTDFLGDVRDYTSVSEAVGTSDGVIHLAGVLGTQETIEEPMPAIETNIVGSLNVFKAVRHYRKRAVYIAVGNHWMNNSYSISKTTAERFAFMFNKEHGTKIAVVRALNAYGPRQKPGPVRKIIPNFVLPALRNEELLVYGDGSQIMDMIHVYDVAEILVWALIRDHGQYDKPFEAGTGRRTSVKDIAWLVLNETGSRKIRHTEMRPGEPEHSVVLGDPSTLEPLGISGNSLTTLEDGIRETIGWYRQSEYMGAAA